MQIRPFVEFTIVTIINSKCIVYISISPHVFTLYTFDLPLPLTKYKKLHYIVLYKTTLSRNFTITTLTHFYRNIAENHPHHICQ